LTVSGTEVPAADAVAEREVVYRIPVDDKHELQAYLQPHEGRRLAHLRLMYVRKDGRRTPTRAGVSIEVGKLSELLVAAAMLVAANGAECSG
jgi:hypothetical protein